MKCPACDCQMEQMSFDNIKVDVCTRGCGGVWFDRFELQRVDEAHESAGERLLDLGPEAGAVVDHAKKRKCPKCRNQVMMRHFFSVKKEIEVDECPRCAGVWADRGELRKIREQFATEADRNMASEKYFVEMFNDDLEKIKDEGRQRLERAKRFANLFRLICPSYYIPGKQSGGAY